MSNQNRLNSAVHGWSLEDIAIVPQKRTVDPDDVTLDWELESFRFELPLMGSAMDSAVSPTTAIEIGRLGGLAVLNLEGLWTRYDDPGPVFREIAALDPKTATARIQELYDRPIKPELITQRIQEMRQAGITTAASLTPARVRRYYRYAQAGGLDLLVIQGTVVSAEHISSKPDTLDLAEFIQELLKEELPVVVGNCANFSTAKNLMKTGAMGVLVGIGPGGACTSRRVMAVGVPQATAIADAVWAREVIHKRTGRWCQVIADGGMSTSGVLAAALAIGADAVMIGSPLASAHEAPGLGYHWGMATSDLNTPRGVRVEVERRGSLEEILLGPAHDSDGRNNLFGGVRMAIASCGYTDPRSFQDAEVMIAPSIRTEGKALQTAQQVGMGN
ncbi:MAG TPA: GuaB3 family IMP dehydrogenase-related protein [Candidatus Saccharimonadales bacterium]|nr:GuaB3 family IMP dehydrogenase-related protein [Candidatus Saccharimonadales bacterium]